MMAQSRKFLNGSPIDPGAPISQVDQMICMTAAADGWGGQTPGAERCGTVIEPLPTAKTAPSPVDMHEIVDWHFGPGGAFWVVYEDYCRPGTLDEAQYLLGGSREVEG